MSITVCSIIQSGFEGVIVEAQCHITNGLPAIIIVGLGGKAVDEAKERLRGAFVSAGLSLPAKRITINLAPADVPKDSSALDVAIATAILSSSKQLSYNPKGTDAFLGEIGLDGSIRPIRGIIGAILSGKQNGITTFFIPRANYNQASLIPDIHLIALDSLADLKTYSGKSAHSIEPTFLSLPKQQSAAWALSHITGQLQAKRALQIAATGGHNVLLYGPPGTGKSMLAKTFTSLLPQPSLQEILEITHLHSLASNNYEQLIMERPLRAPHHTASNISIIGGGARVRPGEISLSHRGVLFLDEMPEFNKATLEALRQPLEDGKVTISRIQQNVTFPANFILIATANPCPCGYFGSPNHSCTCTAAQLQHYRTKLSGPILDRIDMHVQIEEVEHKDLLVLNTHDAGDMSLNQVINKARDTQKLRYGSPDKLNAQMTNSDVRIYALLTTQTKLILNTAAKKLHISARSYMRTIKVARTLADLDNSNSIEVRHITEALQYRPKPAGLEE